MSKPFNTRGDFLYLLWFGVPVLLYQILISRILSQIFGSLFFVQLFLIAVAYLGTALGSYWALRLKVNLTKCHALLVLLNLLLLSFNHWSAELLQVKTLSLVLGFTLFFTISFISSLLLPLFFEEQKRGGLDATNIFNKVYFYFHLLVVVALIYIELGILHTWGLTNILLTLTAAELLWALYWWKKSTAFAATPIPLRKFTDELFKSKDLLVPLFGFSVISGIIQSILYRQVQNVLAPLAFHYSLYLAALVLSWALSSLWFRTKKGYQWLEWASFKKNSGLLVLALLVWSLTWPVLWSGLLDVLHLSSRVREGIPMSPWITSASLPYLSFAIRTIFTFGLVLPSGFFFGSLLPLMKKENDQIPLGTYLSINSCGNAVGILLFISVLFEATGIFKLWTLLGLLCLIFTSRAPRAKAITAATVVILCSLTYFLTKNYSWDLGSYSHRSLQRWISDTKSITGVRNYKHNSSQVSFIELENRYDLMIMNGHHSINLPRSAPYSMADTLMGLTPLSYVHKFNKALVIGLGTGATAMGAAETFQRTDIVDLDPTMLQVVANFKEVDARLKTKKVQFIEADGLTYLRTNKQKYDLVINNVPSPVYFAAAKLWSREALEAVYNTLNEDGIFAQWLDGELTSESINILLETSKGLFNHCDMFILQNSFYSLICSKGDQPLVVQGHPVIAATLMKTTPELYARFFEALKIPNPSLEPMQTGLPINSLDHPYMDVLVARLPPGWLNNDTDNVALHFDVASYVSNKDGSVLSPEKEAKCKLMAEWLYNRKFELTGELCSPLF